VEKIYKIDGIYCAMGVIKIQKKLKAIRGVKDAKFDLKTCIATVNGEPNEEDIFNAVKDSGFQIAEITA